MGARNVKLVYEAWADLPGAAFRLLVWMALATRDVDAPPIYWAGREHQAYGLGRAVPAEDQTDPKVTAERDAAYEAVRRAVRTLTDWGAVRVVRNQGPGTPRAYALILDVGTGDAERAL